MSAKWRGAFDRWAGGKVMFLETRRIAWEAWQEALLHSFQSRVHDWMLECFGAEIAADKRERNHRFFEESTELVQSLGMTAGEAHQLVDYVYGRPIGEPQQESGGVSVTHAALCLANDIDMIEASEVELTRVWTKVDVIRAKQAAKPKHSPLPEAQRPSDPPQFPTMLRKMWSGGEVQRWVDENWNKAPAAPRAPDVGRCNEVLRERGKAYPRTCAVCGLGPCRRGLEYPR